MKNILETTKNLHLFKHNTNMPRFLEIVHRILAYIYLIIILLAFIKLFKII